MAAQKTKEVKWVLKPPPPESFFSLIRDVPPLLVRILWNRGIKSSEEASVFLKPDYHAHLHDPFLFRHMGKAAERIYEAALRKEPISIFGDYDADGVCGAAILHEFFNKTGVAHDVYIPDRSKEHFGLSIQKVKDFSEAGTKLLITVDCGVTDYDEIELARSLGIDVIILDHHIVPPRWPEALAIIDHKHPEETYPERVLSGAGLAFKLVQSLIKSGKFDVPAGWEKWLLDLVAIAAIADMVPLNGENRVLVSYGLKVLSKTKRLGLKQMFALNGRDPKDADTETISHFIAPRINAASRMDHANTAFLLLTTKHEEEARWLAERLEAKNEERKRVVDSILAGLTENLSASRIPSVIFAGSSEWPAGVLGLAAARLVEEYQRPVFLYAENREMIKGSCRAPQGVNVVELMTQAGHALSNFGGHTLSGGFAALPENLPTLKQAIELAADGIRSKNLRPTVEIDAEMSIEDIDETVLELVKSLEPFGQGNPRPLFLVKKAKIADLRKVGSRGEHLKMKLGPGYTGAIYFRAGENEFRAGNAVDLVAELTENVWNGKRSVELRVIHARNSE